MTTLYDILQKISDPYSSKKVGFGPWEKTFLESLSSQVAVYRKVSTKQVVSLVGVLSKRKALIAKTSGISEIDIEKAIAANRWPSDIKIYDSVDVKREVRYLGNSKLAFRFKRTQELWSALSEIKRGNATAEESIREANITVIRVTPFNLERVFKLISDFRFDFDGATLEFMTRCTNTKNDPPQLVADDETIGLLVPACPMLASIASTFMDRVE